MPCVGGAGPAASLPWLVMRPCPEIRGQLAGQTFCQQSPLGEQLFGGYETIRPSALYIVKMSELINILCLVFAIYYQLHRVTNMGQWHSVPWGG